MPDRDGGGETYGPHDLGDVCLLESGDDVHDGVEVVVGQALVCHAHPLGDHRGRRFGRFLIAQASISFRSNQTNAVGLGSSYLADDGRHNDAHQTLVVLEQSMILRRLGLARALLPALHAPLVYANKKFSSYGMAPRWM
jgi:hypothetical protein